MSSIELNLEVNGRLMTKFHDQLNVTSREEASGVPSQHEEQNHINPKIGWEEALEKGDLSKLNKSKKKKKV